MGKEFRQDDGMPGLFAATPPLEGLRALLSEAATIGPEDKVMGIVDVSRAFFEAPVMMDVCVELSEDLIPEDIQQIWSRNCR